MKINRKFTRNNNMLSLEALLQSSTAHKILGAITALGFVLQPMAGEADSVITRADGVQYGDSKKITFNEGVAEIYAATFVNKDIALNRFSQFNLAAGNIANMHFNTGAPTSIEAANLLNFVDERININGTVNAVKNNKIGGNLFFLSPDGMAVGKSGVINAGALYVATPTKSEYQKYIGTADTINTTNFSVLTSSTNYNEKLKNLIDTTEATGFKAIPINASGTIVVLGKVNTVDGVNMRAAKIGVGKNVNDETFDGVAANGTTDSASIKSGITDFSNVVNIEASGLTGDALKATKTGSGDIVLAAESSIADNNAVVTSQTQTAKDVNGNYVTTTVKNILISNNKADASVDVAKGAVIDAAGDAKLTATALNNVDIDVDKDGNITYTSYKIAGDDGIVGETATTTAIVNIDGKVSGKHVDIAANAVNRYVSADIEKLAKISDIADLGVNDLVSSASPIETSYAKLTSNAEVNIGTSADVKATGEDIVTIDETTESEISKTHALNITAYSDVNVGVGASNSLLDKFAKEVTPNINVAGVSYSESNNSAEVNIKGSLQSSAGSTNIAIKANNTVASVAANSSGYSATDVNTKNKGIGYALNLTKGTNTSKVVIDDSAKMNTYIAGDLSISAVSTNSVKTSAEIDALNEKTAGAAVNLTEYNSSADVEINADISSDGKLAINADSTYTDNSVNADTSIGAKSRFNKIATEAAQKGLTQLPDVFKKIAEKLANKNNSLIEVGASVAYAKESNKSGVKLGNGVDLKAGKNLNIAANSIIEDTNVTASGTGYKYSVADSKDISAAVAYSNLDNDASVTIASENTVDSTNVTLNGVNVTVEANSKFEYNRISRMINDIKTAYSEAYDKIIDVCKNNSTSEKATEISDIANKINKTLETLEKTGKTNSLDENALADLYNEIEAFFVDVKADVQALASVKNLADIQNYANFGASSKVGGNSTVAVAGSAVITELANNARVLVGQNADLTATSKLNLNAASSQYDVALAGSPLASNGSNAIGGTASYNTTDANSLVVVAKGASLSAGDIAISADNNINHIQIAVGAGNGTGSGVEGMAVYTDGSSNSIVSVDDEATLTAIAKPAIDEQTGNIAITANNATNLYSAAGVLGKGTTAGVGAVAAIIDFDRYNYAAIADNAYIEQVEKTQPGDGKNNEPQPETITSINEDDNADRNSNATALNNAASSKLANMQKLVQNASKLNTDEQSNFFGTTDKASSTTITASSLDVAANTSGEIVNVTVAGGYAKGKNPAETKLTDIATKIKALDSKSADKGNALSSKTSNAKSSLPDTSSTTSGTSSGTGTGGGMNPGAGASIAGAGSVSVNIIDADTAAVIDNAKISITNDTANNNVSITAQDKAVIAAASGAGAIAWKGAGTVGSAVGVAGVAAVNDVNRATLAVMQNSKVENADAINNIAQNSGAIVAAGVGLAVSKGTTASVGASANSSVNMADNTVYALLQNNNVNQKNDANDTSIANTAFDNDIQITGGMTDAISVGTTSDKPAAAGGVTVVYGDLANDVQSVISGGSYNKIADADIKAVTNITQVGVAANLSLATGTQGTTYAFGANVAYNKLDNYANATVEDVTSFSGKTLDVTAYDNADIANEHTTELTNRSIDADGSVYLKQVQDAANENGDVSVTTQKDETTKEEKEISRTSSTPVDVSRRGNVIVTGTASADISLSTNSSSKGAAADGTFAVSDIDNDYNATIKNSTITLSKDGTASVKADSKTTMAGFAAGAAATNGSFALGGSVNWQSLNNDVTAIVENSTIVAPKLDVDASSSALAVNVAGQLGVTAGTKSKLGAGIAVAYNSLNNTTGAYIKGSDVKGIAITDRDNTTYGSTIVKVNAANKGSVYSVGAAVSAGTAEAALNGAVVVNKGSNNVEAVIDSYTGTADKTATEDKRTKLNNVSSVEVKSEDKSNQLAVIGSVSVAAGANAKAAAGGSIAINDIGTLGKTENTKQHNTAAINNTDITTATDGKINVNAADKAQLTTVSVGSSVTTGKAAFAGAGTAAIVKKNTEATMSNTNVNNGEITALNGDVKLAADSDSKITTVSVLVAGAQDAAISSGIAVNQLDTDTNTKLDSGTYNVNSLTADAESKTEILSVGVAAGASGKVGIAGNFGVNLLANDTATNISDAKITANDTVAALANSDDKIQNYAGTFGISTGAVGVGISVAYNKISGNTSAVVSDSTLIANGKDDNKGNKGIVVAADAQHTLTNAVVTAGVAGGSEASVGVAGTVAFNEINGSTSAKITKATANDLTNSTDYGDVSVLATDNTTINNAVGTTAGGIGATAGVAFGAASDTNLLSRDVTAQIAGNDVAAQNADGDATLQGNDNNTKNKTVFNANKLNVAAAGNSTLTTTAMGAAIGASAVGSASIAGTVSVIKSDAETFAGVSNITSSNNGLSINAAHNNDITMVGASVAASGGMGSGTVGMGVGVLSDESTTEAELKNATINHNIASENDINDKVHAENTTNVTTGIATGSVGISIGGAAAGVVGVNNLNNTVKTTVQDSSINNVAPEDSAKSTTNKVTVNIDAQNNLETSFTTVAGSGGFAAGSVGVGVNTVDTSVVTEINKSTINADIINVNAKETRDFEQTAINASVGGTALSFNVLVNNVGTTVQNSYTVDNGESDKTKETKFDLDGENSALANADKAISGQNTTNNEYYKTYVKQYDNVASSTTNTGAVKTIDKVGRGGLAEAQGVQTLVNNDSKLTAADTAEIKAQTTTNTNITAGGATAGTYAAAGTVSISNVERNSGVTVQDSTVTGKQKVAVTALQDGLAKMNIYQGVAALASANLAVGVNNISGTNNISLTSATINSDKNIDITAEDNSSAQINAIGATTGTFAAGVIVAKADNDSTTAVKVDASTLTTKQGDEEKTNIIATNTNATETKVAKTIAVNAVKANSVTVNATGGVAGSISVNGVVALATDKGSSKVSMSGANTLTTDNVAITATNKPAVAAKATAYNGSVIGTVGVTVAKATVASNAKDDTNIAAKLDVENGSTFAAKNVELTANVTTQTNEDKETIENAKAEAEGAAFAVVGAGTYNGAYANNTMKTAINLGSATYKEVNQLNINASNASNIKADAKGVTIGGVASSGSNLAETDTNLTTTITATGATTGSTLGAVKINGSSIGNVYNKADGSGGGIVNISPIAAYADNNLQTTTTVNVNGGWDNIDSMSVYAVNSDDLDVTADSLSAAIIDASGTEVVNKVNHEATINVKGNITTDGKQSYIASNIVNHDVDLKGSGYGAVTSDVSVMQNTLSCAATVNMNDATLKGTGEKGAIEAEAYTSGKMDYDSVLKSAGVVSGIMAVSDNTLTYDNSVNATNSSLTTSKADQDITLAATDKTTASFDTTADTQGGTVGAASAKTTNELNRSNKININGGKMLSTNDVNLYAGADLDGISSSLDYNVVAEAYNKTTVPLKTQPSVKNSMTQNNQVNIGYEIADDGSKATDSSSDVESVRHINLKAGKGITTVANSARSYNQYTKEGGNGEITSTIFGETTDDEVTANFVDVAGGSVLKAGVHNTLGLTITGKTEETKVAPNINEDGEIIGKVDEKGNEISGEQSSINYNNITITISEDAEDWFDNESVIIGSVDIKNDLMDRYDELNTLMTEYAPSSNEYAYFASEKERVISQMRDNGFVKTTTVNVKNGDTTTTKDVDFILDSREISAIDLPDIVISGGNINIDTDNLQGSGSLKSQGANNLSITNTSNLYLKVDDLTIKDKGGEINYNGVALTENAIAGFDGNIASDAASNKEPSIDISSSSEDIGVFGSVLNSTGNINIENEKGNINIYSSSEISARNITIAAENGSVTQSSKGLLLIGSDPVTKWQFSEDIANKIQEQLSTEAQLLDANDRTFTNALNALGSSEEDSSEKDQYEKYKEILLEKLTTLTEPEKTTIREYKIKESSGIHAGGNVYITALNVNIDGLVQSGYQNYTVTLDENALEKIKELDAQVSKTLTDNEVLSNDAYCINKCINEDGDAATYNSETGVYDYTVKVYYNPSTKKLLTETIEPAGGKVYITGAISSTGNGRIYAMDGTPDINIDTTAVERDLLVNTISNNDIDGLISIRDTAQNQLKEYRSNGTKIDVTTYILKNGNAGSKKSETLETNDNGTINYQPLKDTILTWSGGTDGGKHIVEYSYKEKFLFWGGLDYSKTRDFAKNEAVDAGKTTVKDSAIDTISGSTLKTGTVISTKETTNEYSVSTKVNKIPALDENNKPKLDEKGNPIYEVDYSPVTVKKKYSGTFGKIFGYGINTYTWTESTGTSTTSSYTIKADKPISVGFLTSGKGDINITSGGKLYINSNISSATQTVDGTKSGIGNVTLTAVDAILSNGDARVSTDNLTANVVAKVEKTTTQDNTTNDKLNTITPDVMNNDMYSLAAVAEGGTDAGTGTSRNTGTDTGTTGSGTQPGTTGTTETAKTDTAVQQQNTAIAINHSAIGKNATISMLANEGDVSINSDSGALNFTSNSTIGSVNGNLTVTSAGDITTSSDNTVLQGKRIDLTSKQGAINAKVAPGQTPSEANTLSASVNASAYGDITLTNSNGDMRIGHIESTTGDVTLTTSGSFIDAACDSTLSDANSKIDKWKEMGLVSDADEAGVSTNAAESAKSERVTALEKRGGQLAIAELTSKEVVEGKLNEYKNIVTSHKEANNTYIEAYKEALELTDAKAKETALTNARDTYKAALKNDIQEYSDSIQQWIIDYGEAVNITAASVNDIQDIQATTIAKLEASGKQLILTANTSKDAVNAKLIKYKELVNNYLNTSGTDDFSQNYSDELKQWIIDYADVTNSKNYGWSQNDLLYAIQDGVLNSQAGEHVIVNKANVAGKNITLTANKDIGIDDTATTIEYSKLKNLDSLKLLAQCKAGDLKWDNVKEEVTVSQQHQITVQTADDGRITLNANKDGIGDDGKIYIAGVMDSPLNITGTISTTKDVKLLADKGVYMNDGSITAKNLIIYGGSGSVGSADKNIITNISGTLDANSDPNNGVYIHQKAIGESTTAQPLVLQAVATGTLMLTADNGITMSTEAGKTDGYISAKKITLTATNGNIGKEDVTVNGETTKGGIRIQENGVNITATANNGSVYLQGATATSTSTGTGLNINSIEAGNQAVINAKSNITLVDDDTNAAKITAGENASITSTAGGITLTTGTITATNGDATLNAANNIALEQGTVTASEGTIITSTAGGITLTTGAITAKENSSITANTNIDLGTSTITIGTLQTKNSLTLNAKSFITQSADTGGITVDTLIVQSGKDQQLLSKNNKVNNLLIEGQGKSDDEKYEKIDGVTKFVGTADNLQVTTNNPNITGDVLIQNYAANGNITINSNIRTALYNYAHKGSITIIADKNITTAENIVLSSKDAISITSTSGNINTNGEVNGKNGVKISTQSGDIAIRDVRSDKANVIIKTDVGNITTGRISDIASENILGNIVASNGNVQVQTDKGDILINGYTGGKNVKYTTSDGSIFTNGMVIASGTKTDSGKIISGDVTYTATDGITAEGLISAAGDLTMTNTNCGITTKSLTSKNINITNKDGDVTINGAANANGTEADAGRLTVNITKEGNITANSSLAGQVIDLYTAYGDITTAGQVKASENVVMNTSDGNITTDKLVKADNSSVTLNTNNGDIQTKGKVEAKKNVDYNAKGEITTNSSITSTNGSINLQTDDAEGNMTYGSDVTAEHGNINISVLQNGNVKHKDNPYYASSETIPEDIKFTKFTANGDKDDAESGNFTLKIAGTGDVDLGEIYAKNGATLDLADGDLYLNKIDGELVAIQLRTEGKQMLVHNLIAGTKILIKGSNMDLGKIKQRLDADSVLTIVPDGSSDDKPIDDLKIGDIETNKGVRFAHLWLNTGSLNISEGPMYLDKLVVNNVAHFSNKYMTTAVWGAPPQRDGSDSVYWNDIRKNNPAQSLTEWQEDGSTPAKWMYLNFTNKLNVQQSNGVLLDLHNYDYVYWQRYTGTDYLQHLLGSKWCNAYELDNSVVRYFRHNLYDLEAEQTKPAKVIVEA